MTEKQERIIQAALQLFSEKGYAATSTSKVAKAAGVSEGLIFRHFGNKEGLLQAILNLGTERANVLYQHVLTHNQPKQALRAILEMAFEIEEEQFPFWKLVYSLKWQADMYDDTISASLKKALIDVFSRLNYKEPGAEAELILMIIDGIATARLLHRPAQESEVRKALLAKYQL